jgi:hypothetical protein
MKLGIVWVRECTAKKYFKAEKQDITRISVIKGKSRGDILLKIEKIR